MCTNVCIFSNDIPYNIPAAHKSFFFQFEGFFPSLLPPTSSKLHSCVDTDYHHQFPLPTSLRHRLLFTSKSVLPLLPPIPRAATGASAHLKQPAARPPLGATLLLLAGVGAALPSALSRVHIQRRVFVFVLCLGQHRAGVQFGSQRPVRRERLRLTRGGLVPQQASPAVSGATCTPSSTFAASSILDPFQGRKSSPWTRERGAGEMEEAASGSLSSAPG